MPRGQGQPFSIFNRSPHPSLDEEEIKIVEKDEETVLSLYHFQGKRLKLEKSHNHFLIKDKSFMIRKPRGREGEGKWLIDLAGNANDDDYYLVNHSSITNKLYSTPDEALVALEEALIKQIRVGQIWFDNKNDYEVEIIGVEHSIEKDKDDLVRIKLLSNGETRCPGDFRKNYTLLFNN